MENNLIEFTPAPVTPAQAINVSGTYQLLEFDKNRALLPLNIIVTVTQKPDHLTIDLLNEANDSRTQLNYPVKDLPCWSDERKAYIQCRPVSGGFIADIIAPAKKEAGERTTFRITWQVDAQKRIHETFEDFDANGNRLASSTGYTRVLVPIKEN